MSIRQRTKTTYKHWGTVLGFYTSVTRKPEGFNHTTKLKDMVDR